MTTRDASTGPSTERAGRNRPAQVGAVFATGVVAALLSFATVVGWVNPPFFLAVAVTCSLGAIVAGHVGRSRGRHEGRGLALTSILVGWLGLVVSALGLLVTWGLLAGLAAVTG